MKKTLKKTLLLLIMMLVVCPVAVEAQSKKIKFGQVTAEDFAVKPLAKDSDAVAIYLHEADEYHFMITASLVINHTRDVRLLVLKDEGKEFANFEIPADARALKACAINMVNGKPVRTDIKKENISVEEISKGSKSVKVKKFAVPEVRVGTIIDVHYVEDCGWVDEINFQRSIPIKYRFVDYSLPEIIQSTMNTRGYMIARPTIKECDIVLGSNSYYGKQYLFEFNDVPALKKDKYVKCIDDYRSGIELQFEGINIPGIVWTDSDFETWAEVFKVLADDEDFGKQIINKNPLSEETKSVVNSDRSDADKILALARLVQEKIKWNDYISIYPSKGIRKALKEGKGNSADMNFLLYEMLKDAGYETNLMLLCPRSRGHLPYGRPFWKRLFMAIVQVVTKSGETYYIDASDKYGWANVLDANFMANRALIYDPNAANAKEVNLSKLNTSRQAEIYKAKLDANGNLAGSANCSTTNQLARIYKAEHAKDADNNKTIEALEEVNDFSISDYKVVGMDSTSVIQNFNFEKECNVSADGRITLNPSIAPMLPKNPFTDKERLLPVEFDSPSTYVVTTMIELPEGYMAEELPKPISMMACNGKLSLKYTIVQQDSRLVLNFNYSHKDTFFPKEDYEHISYFYTELSRLSNLQIVIKKGS